MEKSEIIEKIKSVMKDICVSESEESEISEPEGYNRGLYDGMLLVAEWVGVLTSDEWDELEKVARGELAEERKIIEELEKKGYQVERTSFL